MVAILNVTYRIPPGSIGWVDRMGYDANPPLVGSLLVCAGCLQNVLVEWGDPPSANVVEYWKAEFAGLLGID